MNDTPASGPLDEPSADDLLVSRVLDGDAGSEEAARVHADPRLSARYEAFASLAAALGEPPPAPDAATTGRAVAAALAATGRLDPGGDRVVPLRPRGRRLLAVAAGLLVVVAVAATLRAATDDDGTDVTTADAPALERVVSDAPTGEAIAADMAIEDSDGSALLLVDYGEHASVEDLFVALGARRAPLPTTTAPFAAGEAAVPPPAGTSRAGCPGPVLAAGDVVEEAGEASIEGRPVAVVVVATAAGDRIAWVYDADSCALLTSAAI